MKDSMPWLAGSVFLTAAVSSCAYSSSTSEAAIHQRSEQVLKASKQIAQEACAAGYPEQALASILTANDAFFTHQGIPISEPTFKKTVAYWRAIYILERTDSPACKEVVAKLEPLLIRYRQEVMDKNYEQYTGCVRLMMSSGIANNIVNPNAKRVLATIDSRTSCNNSFPLVLDPTD